MKIYTKTGDNGETSLFNGKRVKKNDLRIITYGVIDEASSHIGLLLYYIKQESKFEEIEDILINIQNQLFILGSDLANPDNKIKDYPRISSEDIVYLEKSIDRYEKTLEPLRSFILPGGSLESSYCHIVRTVIRRAEVNIAELALKDEINKSCLVYLNRLSDFFFILSRVINSYKGILDIPWRPKKN
jgi:cob(I)alamin adenosyltransferase